MVKKPIENEGVSFQRDEGVLSDMLAKGTEFPDSGAIEREYKKRKGKYEKLKNEVIYILESELKAAGIPYHMIVGRVKTLNSLIEKIERKSVEQSFDEVVDICGIRVACLFLSDIEKIGIIIENKFELISKDDKVFSKPQDVFGYLSVHYVGKLHKKLTGARYDDIKELRFEIQIRTISMHVWSTISHYIDYKSLHSVPSYLRKDFYALSALFYLADSHFELFFRNSQKARQLAEQKADQMSAIESEEINLDTLTAYLKIRYPDRKHADPIVISKVVDELIDSGCTKIADLDAYLNRSRIVFELYEKENPPKNALQFSDVGVLRISLSIANEKYLKNRKPSKELSKRYDRFRKYLTN